MVDYRCSSQSSIGSAQRCWHFGMLNRESPHVHFIDDALVPRRVWRTVGAPSERMIHDHGLQHAGSAVATINGEISVLAADAIAEMRIAPFQFADNLFRIGIKQKLIGVEAMALVRFVVSVNAVSVD